MKCPVCGAELRKEEWPGDTGVVYDCPSAPHFKRVTDWLNGTSEDRIYESNRRRVTDE